METQLSGFNAEVEVGGADMRVGADWSARMLDGLEVKIGAGIGLTSGMNTVLSVARKVTEWTKLTLSIEGVYFPG